MCIYEKVDLPTIILNSIKPLLMNVDIISIYVILLKEIAVQVLETSVPIPHQQMELVKDAKQFNAVD